MELKYVALTILKILIAIPSMFIYKRIVFAEELMGGHLKHNSNNSSESMGLSRNHTGEINSSKHTLNEEIPDPSALVLPGYNLPESIFNKGKPFYLEKDPLTGEVDFDSKGAPIYQEYDNAYVDIYAKDNIDRKDGSLSAHQPSDMNQLTPNFYDFLNLPVKYHPEKYVYPLVSSSYANTKVQGSVSKYHNHKLYSTKSTMKPKFEPTYIKSTLKPHRPSVSTTTPKIFLTTEMTQAHHNVEPSEEFEDYLETTLKPSLEVSSIRYSVSTTQQPSTTKKILSLFEQLFGGDYEEDYLTTAPTIPPNHSTTTTSHSNLYNKEQSVSPISPSTYHPNSHAGPYVFTESSSNVDTYDYEEEHMHHENVSIQAHDDQNNERFSTTTSTTESVEIIQEKTTLQSATQSKTNINQQERVTTIRPEANTSIVTSLPLGEHHLLNLNNHQPIIVATQNLREQLNNEKVVKEAFPFASPPSKSNVIIAPDQDMVSFVVGDHQNVEGDQYMTTNLKESPYDSNPFRPLYGPDEIEKLLPSGQVNVVSAINIQPQKNSEASLSIGVPVTGVKSVPGQVVDEKLHNAHQNEFPKGSSNKIVFPSDDDSDKMFMPPPPNNKDILTLSSNPTYHQLPSDLTPPKQGDNKPIERPRPPWDPRPGHFHTGKPEYVRPPRPDIPYKRVDSLPNILPQFRPNANNKHHYRQPLLERPSNRPIGFFEKLQPPPPPKNLHNLRKMPPPPKTDPMEAEDRLISDAAYIQDQYDYYHHTPPKVVLANKRVGNVESDVETLQMIHAKQAGLIPDTKPSTHTVNNEVTDKPIYVVYPVNVMPKISNEKKETVIVGTRAEVPLPPIQNAGNLGETSDSIFRLKERNEAPVVKPQHRPTLNAELSVDFPYPIERPDSSIFNSAHSEHSSNTLDGTNDNSSHDEHWNLIQNANPPASNQISATLKTYTERPIAVAYTPTEPHYEDKYSMPNYGKPVIAEILPETVNGKVENEYSSMVVNPEPHIEPVSTVYNGASYEFQAPFQASVNMNSMSQGWSVVRDKNKTTTEEPTTLSAPSSSEFDIENFKPQLIGGFRPLLDTPEDVRVSDRQE